MGTTKNRAHRLFYRLADPLPMLTVGACCSASRGTGGGPITLFKGLDQMKELAAGACVAAVPEATG